MQTNLSVPIIIIIIIIIIIKCIYTAQDQKKLQMCWVTDTNGMS